MAATTTRTLVLGVVRLFAPANGYQLRRELLSWNVDSWANVNPGSIYSMLATLSKQGMIEAHAVPDGARAVTVYTMTEPGGLELDRLIRDGLSTVSAMDPSAFRVALSFAPLVSRADFLELLTGRLDAVRRGAGGLKAEAATILDVRSAPPHVGYSLDLEARMLQTEAEWIVDLLEVVRGGGLDFAGEPETWMAPTDDAGWEMVRESARYREQLERMDSSPRKA
ncbi:PadR family transcriptional regulator [Leifsonia poae]|uniref:PadR family transcriptional regulator n=1 Tax=Leifsonia poae TaxID=110933 RepID=UPI001CC0AF18|nr:PadR family transcriptional regulator [Leifsonia poae]